MKQNKYFSLKRFSRLLRNDLLINQKIYLFTLAGIGIAIYAISYFLMRVNHGFHRTNEYIPLLMFYLMGIGVVIGTSFPALSNQIKTSNYLLSPGSTLEKILVQFVIRIVLFVPLALIIFWIGTHLAKATLVPDLERGFDPARIADYHFKDLFQYIQGFRDQLIVVLSIFSTASVLFAGSVYFKRFALIKTLIVSGATVFLVVCSFVLFSHILFPSSTHGFDVAEIDYKINNNLYNIQLAVYLLGGLSWIFFLPLAYFKLKEKEV